MAECKEVEKGLQDLEKEITCAICHKHYTEPKVLPCCHYYCKQCIRNLVQRKPFSCPECRADITLPAGGVKNLPAAFFVNRMKEVHSKLELAHGKVEAKCEICSIDKAEAFCRQCAQFICAECVKSHQRMKKAFPGHKIVTLEELKKGGAPEIVMKESTIHMCQLHEQQMNVYCFDCKTLYCSIKAHSNHNHESVKVAVTDTKKKLLEKLSSLGDTKGTLSQALKIVQATKASIIAQGKSEEKKIESSFAELIKIIEQRKKELVEESKKSVNKKLERLSSQEKSLSTKCAVVQSVVDYTKQCIQHSSDDEVMSKHSEMNCRIDKELKVEDLDPVEEADTDIEVSCAEDLKKLCRTKAKLHTQLSTLKCFGITSGNQPVKPNVKAEYRVAIKFSNGQPKVKKGQVTCGFDYPYANTSYQLNQVEAGEYCILYTPVSRSSRTITISITVNRQTIDDGRFKVHIEDPLNLSSHSSSSSFVSSSSRHRFTMFPEQ